MYLSQMGQSWGLPSLFKSNGYELRILGPFYIGGCLRRILGPFYIGGCLRRTVRGAEGETQGKSLTRFQNGSSDSKWVPKVTQRLAGQGFWSGGRSSDPFYIGGCRASSVRLGLYRKM